MKILTPWGETETELTSEQLIAAGFTICYPANTAIPKSYDAILQEILDELRGIRMWVADR